MIERIEELSDPTPSPPLERTSGNYWLIETLRRWEIGRASCRERG